MIPITDRKEDFDKVGIYYLQITWWKKTKLAGRAFDDFIRVPWKGETILEP